MDDQVGMGVCHCNMATTYEMMENVEETADQHEKVSQPTLSLSLSFDVSCGYVHLIGR